MVEGRLKTINIAAKSAGCFDTIDLVDSLPPLKSGDKPKLCDDLIVKNTGGTASYIACYIFESNSSRECTTALWSGTTPNTIDSDGTYDFGSITATEGVSKDYDAGSALYLCFKVWATRDESSWTGCPEKSCSTPAAAVKIQWAGR